MPLWFIPVLALYLGLMVGIVSQIIKHPIEVRSQELDDDYYYFYQGGNMKHK
jgi:hypothetical protein